jgi:hypothetical protein
MHGFGDAEIDHLHDRGRALARHEDVGGFQVAVNDAPLVRVLHRGAHLQEKRESVGQRKAGGRSQ